MIKINLIPYREKAKKENLQRQIVIIAGSFTIFLLVIIAVHVFMSSNLGDLETRVSQAESRLLALDKQVGDVEKVKQVKKELQQKLEVIDKLDRDRYLPVRLLDGLNQLVPSREMWLEKITMTGQTVTIEGNARDNAVVAMFMKKMEKAPFLSSVDLLGTQEKEIVGVKLQHFVITCGINSKGE